MLAIIPPTDVYQGVAYAKKKKFGNTKTTNKYLKSSYTGSFISPENVQAILTLGQ